MKRICYVQTLILLTVVLALSSCTQKKQAKIEIKPPNFLSANSSTSYKELKTPSQLKMAGLNYYHVKDGDSILSISKKLKIDIAIIVEINGMQPPYKLKAGDILYLPTDIVQEDNAIKSANLAHQNPVINKKEDNKVTESDLNPVAVSKFIWPVKGKVVSKFGSKPGGITNNGINIKAPAGSDIKAVADGTVIFVGEGIKGYGNLVLVKHNSEWVSAYAYQKQTLVKQGDFVKQGETIGYVGKSGDVKVSQLHFALRKNGKSVNPLNYITS